VRSKEDIDKLKGEQPWVSGVPYYCALCGAGGGERLGCEEPDCALETKEEAVARRNKFLSEGGRA
jgi:hypothetical protein